MSALTVVVEVAGVGQATEVVAHRVEAPFQAQPLVQQQPLVGELVETQVLALAIEGLVLDIGARGPLVDGVAEAFGEHHPQRTVEAECFAGIDRRTQVDVFGGGPATALVTVAVDAAATDHDACAGGLHRGPAARGARGPIRTQQRLHDAVDRFGLGGGTRFGGRHRAIEQEQEQPDAA